MSGAICGGVVSQSKFDSDPWAYMMAYVLPDDKYTEGIEADFRDSDLVSAFWSIDLHNRQAAWDMLVEAGSLGAKQERIKELAEKWGCNDEDGMIYCERIGIVAEMDGNMWCCCRKDFTNLQESPCGFGETILDALIDFCKNLDFKTTKLNWHARFNKLVKF